VEPSLLAFGTLPWTVEKEGLTDKRREKSDEHIGDTFSQNMVAERRALDG
jgi:hypothetical protein